MKNEEDYEDTDEEDESVDVNNNKKNDDKNFGLSIDSIYDANLVERSKKEEFMLEKEIVKTEIHEETRLKTENEIKLSYGQLKNYGVFITSYRGFGVYSGESYYDLITKDEINNLPKKAHILEGKPDKIDIYMNIHKDNPDNATIYLVRNRTGKPRDIESEITINLSQNMYG
jgi:hypothetical protein